jgi:hypothetical protein
MRTVGEGAALQAAPFPFVARAVAPVRAVIRFQNLNAFILRAMGLPASARMPDAVRHAFSFAP